MLWWKGVGLYRLANFYKIRVVILFTLVYFIQRNMFNSTENMRLAQS